MSEARITPLARRLAEENGIDWQKIPGSGPDGTIVERDILAFLAKVMAGEVDLPPAAEPAPPPPPLSPSELSKAQAALEREGVQLQEILPEAPEEVSFNKPTEDLEFDLDLETAEPAPLAEAEPAPVPELEAWDLPQESLEFPEPFEEVKPEPAPLESEPPPVWEAPIPSGAEAPTWQASEPEAPAWQAPSAWEEAEPLAQTPLPVSGSILSWLWSRTVDLGPAQEASQLLGEAGYSVGVEELLLEAAARSLRELGLALIPLRGVLEGDRLRGYQVPQVLGQASGEEAPLEGALVALSLLDQPYTGLLSSSPLLWLSTLDGRALLSVSGLEAGTAQSLLDRVAYYLERPLLLALPRPD